MINKKTQNYFSKPPYPQVHAHMYKNMNVGVYV